MNKVIKQYESRQKRAKTAHTRVFKAIVYSLTILSILAVAMGTVQVSSESIIYSWGFPEAEALEDDMKVWVLREVHNAGLDAQIVNCLIASESGWNQWAYNINNNGSTDFGLWQINSIHKATISVEDRWDYKESTKWAINKIKHDGNYNAWYGYLNNCR